MGTSSPRLMGVGHSLVDGTYSDRMNLEFSDEIKPEITIVPANEASWEDLQAVFGTRGDTSRCQCQWYKIRDMRVAFGSRRGTRPPAARADRLWAPGVGHDERPRRLPRRRTRRLVRGRAAHGVRAPDADARPWTGRSEDKTDDGIWAVTCFVTRTGSGVEASAERSPAPPSTSPDERGARALEGYPMITQPGQEITWGELTSAAAASSLPPGSPRSAGQPSAGW